MKFRIQPFLGFCFSTFHDFMALSRLHAREAGITESKWTLRELKQAGRQINCTNNFQPDVSNILTYSYIANIYPLKYLGKHYIKCNIKSISFYKKGLNYGFFPKRWEKIYIKCKDGNVSLLHDNRLYPIIPWAPF